MYYLIKIVSIYLCWLSLKHATVPQKWIFLLKETFFVTFLFKSLSSNWQLQICTKLLFFSAEEPATVFMLSQLQESVLKIWIPDDMSGLSLSAAATKASSCLLVPGRHNAEHNRTDQMAFKKLSLWIVLLPTHSSSIPKWHFDVRALMQMCMAVVHPAGELADAVVTSA